MRSCSFCIKYALYFAKTLYFFDNFGYNIMEHIYVKEYIFFSENYYINILNCEVPYEYRFFSYISKNH